MKVAAALSIGATLAWATLDGAMAAVPSSDTEASPVLALAVLLAPRIALLALAELSRPSLIADASPVLATAVRAAVQVAQTDRTVFACPARITRANVASLLD